MVVVGHDWSVAVVVAVHGINNTYSAPERMVAQWVPDLLGGVSVAGGAEVLSPSDVQCVFYGDVFRRPGRTLGDEDELSELADADLIAGLDEQEAAVVAAWWAEAARVDDQVMPPQARTLGVASGVQAALAALAGSRFLAGATERLLLVWLWQVRAYFTRPQVRAEIQRRMAAGLGSDTRVVVAHSLGSVIAYEALAARVDAPPVALVTLGSPLGLRSIVLDRLTPPPHRGDRVRGVWPVGVRDWTNIADRWDFVATVKKLSAVFGDGVVDVEISNGTRLHQVQRYLTTAECGAAILAGLGEPIAGVMEHGVGG